MQVITTVTQKGQITLPKQLRDKYKIDKNSRIVVDDGKGHIRIKHAKSILDIAPLTKAPRGKSALIARKKMETSYSRF
ncbi:hypothetical protein A3A52_05240 [Candidatus Woesebacteria bacterium RIFCSPLOWO2_01_FULL_39_14]|nr:MAG: hypothetical protein A3A52_05240 [Candidatus Woesebacteria bacterium RIFCSPLOWO2_01_FULL_39_14]